MIYVAALNSQSGGCPEADVMPQNRQTWFAWRAISSKRQRQCIYPEVTVHKHRCDKNNYIEILQIYKLPETIW